MAGGRPRKPTKLKQLQGTARADRINASEPQFEVGSGYCPRWLSDEARAEWRRVAPELIACGLLTVVDRAALEAYCETYAQWRRAIEALKDGMTFTTDKGYVQQLPEVAIANNALKQMRAFMTEFGMTPSSQSRVSMPQADTEDPFAIYLAESRVTEQLDE